MSDSRSPLHMVQLHLDSRELMRSSHRQKLPGGSDLGYLLHGQLAALFGDLAPKPFHGYELGRGPRSVVEVLGYTSADADTLRQRVETFADPMASEGLLRLASKVMPSTFSPGQRLAFEVRTIPVVRKSSSRPQPRKGVAFRAGAEVDAYVAAYHRGEIDDKTPRREVYARWLEQRCNGAARLQHVDLAQFRRAQVFRRTQGKRRNRRVSERPEALLRGELEVRDSEAFSHLLARGIGRHRAFGFGMLKLRPPGR